jgi:hypothetical protein
LNKYWNKLDYYIYLVLNIYNVSGCTIIINYIYIHVVVLPIYVTRLIPLTPSHNKWGNYLNSVSNKNSYNFTGSSAKIAHSCVDYWSVFTIDQFKIQMTKEKMGNDIIRTKYIDITHLVSFCLFFSHFFLLFCI